MKHILVGGFVSLLLFGHSTQPVQAADFQVSVDSNYTLHPAHTAQVTQTITVTNTTDTRYPTSYAITVPSSQLKNIRLTGMGNSLIKPQIATASGLTKIQIPFKNPVIGKDKSQTYILEYQNPDIIDGNSALPQLILPPLLTTDSNLVHTISVTLPSSSCPEPAVVPGTATITSLNDITYLKITPSNPAQSIFIRCAGKRYLAAALRYRLENQNMTPVETQITLPPDTAYQQFVYDSIEPSPINLFSDTDGNIIATFHLEPKETLPVLIKARAILTATPNPAVTAVKSDKAIVSAQPFWPIHDPAIVSLTGKLTTAADAYKYVVSSFTLQPSPCTRIGGKTLSQSSIPLCHEDIVDNFITLTRSMGIPSRRVVGFAGSLGVWAEYLDPDRHLWVAVDPVREKQSGTLSYFPINDLNHIALVINGTSDSIPYAANLYLDPSISLASMFSDIPAFTIPKITLTANLSAPFFTRLGLSNQLQLTLKNQSFWSLYNEPLTIIAGPNTVKSVTLNRLPLQSQVIIPVNLPNGYEQYQLESNQFGQVILKRPGPTYPAAITVAGFVAAAAGVITVITRRLLVSQ